MRQEFLIIEDKMVRKDRPWKNEMIEGDLNFLADRKAYLLDIAKQSLSSDDYGQFKDLVDAFKIGFWSKKPFRKKVVKKY